MNAPTAITVGTFDGVHTGHRLVFEQLRREAEQRGLHSAAFTFEKHPLALVAPERCPVPLQSVTDKAEAIRSCGVEPVIVPFTDTLRRMSATEFLSMLREEYGARLLLVGHDNRFGFRSHDHSVSQEQALAGYREIGRTLGMEVVAAAQLPGVSSSRIRALLAAGEPHEAAALLGRPWQWTGVVVRGQQLGRTIGFPTANLEGDNPPPAIGPGVYATVATLPDGTTVPAMVNIGHRPTVSNGNPAVTVEAHLIGYAGNLYGAAVTLSFVHRLRSERRFPSLDALRDALTADRDATLALIAQRDTWSPHASHRE